MRFLVAESLARSTRRSYAAAWTRFLAFTSARSLPSLPSSVDAVALYLAALFDEGFSVKTMQVHVAAISFVHLSADVVDPTRCFLVSRVLTGARNTASTADNRAPITIDVLTRLLSAVPAALPAHFSLLARTMFLFAFRAFARISEFTVTGRDSHTLQLADIVFDPSFDFVEICFRSYKASVPGAPATIRVRRNPVKGLCLVSHLRDYFTARPVLPGPLFVLPSGCHVSSRRFAAWFTRVVVHAGLSALRLTPHSFRIGAASHAASLGASDAQIAQLGRWRSAAFRRYIRNTPSWGVS